MAASPTATGSPSLCYSVSLNRQSKPTTRKAMGTVKFVIENPIHFSRTTAKRSFPIRAVDPQREEDTVNPSNNSKPGAFTYQEDLEYLWKLVAASVLGAAVLKYGSVVFPEITRPNIVQALIMITTPVIVAVFILIKQSRAERQS